jgi:hypothetical protein
MQQDLKQPRLKAFRKWQLTQEHKISRQPLDFLLSPSLAEAVAMGNKIPSNNLSNLNSLNSKVPLSKLKVERSMYHRQHPIKEVRKV